MSDQLSVTVLAGSPGNDGSKAFERLIQQSGDVRLTAIVPKRSRKRNSPKLDVPVIPTTERLVRLGEGCACCTVRGDLMAKIQRIAEEKSAEHILIHTPAHTDLSTLAKTFTVADESGAILSDVAQIGSLVTVVDAESFLSTLGGTRARALIERVEMANVVLVDGAATTSPETFEKVLGAIEALNVSARIVRSDADELALSSLHTDQPFDLDLAEERAAGPGTSAGDAGPTGKFSYQARRPFHPTRLHTLLAEPWAGVLRAKGTFWVASRPDFACTLDVAGMSRNTSPDGMWWATVPAEQRPANPALKRYLDTIWHPEFGDRHQSFSILGTDVDENDIRTRLDACLLTDEELKEPSLWAALPDPFPWPTASA